MKKSHSQHILKSVKEAYSEIASEFNQTRKTQWNEFNDFMKYLKKDDRVLDLACGNGRLYELIKVKTSKYIGVDNNKKLLEHAKSNYANVNFQLMDMQKLNFEDKSFDIVYQIASFHHLPTKKLRKECILEIHRVLKDNGILIVTVWNLFQKKYFKLLLLSVFLWIIHLGLKYSWNDFWVKWGNYEKKRYYHAFLPSELLRYFNKKKWLIKDFYFVKKGRRVSFLKSFNICLIVQKKNEK